MIEGQYRQDGGLLQILYKEFGMLMMHQPLCGWDFNISVHCAARCPLPAAHAKHPAAGIQHLQLGGP